MPVFHYSVKTEDLIELGLQQLRANPRAQLQARILHLLVPIAMFLASLGTVYLLDSDKQLMPIDWVVPCVLAVFMLFLFPRRFENNIRKRIAMQIAQGPGKDGAGAYTVTILPNLIVQTAKGREVRAPWTAIGQTAMTDAHIFILVDDSRAIVIPRQGFADTKQFDQVKALVAQYAV
ncbi:MAG: hypothetical protein WCK70_09895 [Chloroflexales bacterium]|jgi:hypothetical protein